MDVMTAYLSIGDFSRATHLTVKTLRHYHQIGLLEPADVDPQTGYRRYATDQLPTAQVIRRFRDLDMPLEEIQAVLAASDLRTRNERITSHLSRLEDELGRTQRAVASLRDLLAPAPDVPARIELRRLQAVPAAAVSAGRRGRGLRYLVPGSARRALRDPRRAARAGRRASRRDLRRRAVHAPPRAGDHLRPLRHPGPADRPRHQPGGAGRGTGGHRALGTAADVDRAYGTLAAYVARHALAVEGPIREYYLVGQHETADTPSGGPRSAGRSSRRPPRPPGPLDGPRPRFPPRPGGIGSRRSALRTPGEVIIEDACPPVNPGPGADRARPDRERQLRRERRARAASGGARLPPRLVRRAPQHAVHRVLRHQRADRAHRRADVEHPARRRRHHAAQPLPAGDRGAVRHPGGDVPGADRPGPGPGTRVRPEHDVRAAPRPAVRGGASRRTSSSCRRTWPAPAGCPAWTPSPARARSVPLYILGSSLFGAQLAARATGCRTRSRRTSRPQTSSPRRGLPQRVQAVRAAGRSRT